LKLQKQLEGFEGKKMNNYDLYKQNKISAEQYKRAIEAMYEEKTILEKELSKKQNELEQYRKQSEQLDMKKKLLDKQFSITESDSKQLKNIIKYVDVYSNDEVEIVYNFDDTFLQELNNEVNAQDD
jgi:butyrate kinase